MQYFVTDYTPGIGRIGHAVKCLQVSSWEIYYGTAALLKKISKIFAWKEPLFTEGWKWFKDGFHHNHLKGWAGRLLSR